MALIGNYSVLSKSPGRFLSGATASGDRANFNKNGMNRNKDLSMSQQCSTPNGYTPPYSFNIARKGGGMAAYTQLSASVSLSGTGAAGINAEAALNASISLSNAQLDQIVSLVASISAAIVTTDAELAAVANLLADSISASMSITDAQLGAIVGMIASLTASGSLAANNFATAALAAEISSLTELSPDSLANSLWNASAASYNTAGSMGEKLNDAGSASNPWTEVIESGYTAQEVLRILLAVAAGQTTITDLGGGMATVTFRDVADSKARVTAGMSGSERISITLDGV